MIGGRGEVPEAMNRRFAVTGWDGSGVEVCAVAASPFSSLQLPGSKETCL